MGYSTLEACVRDLERTGQLRRISEPVNPDQEIAAIQRRAFSAQAPALLFTNPIGTPFPMLANLFGTHERVEYIFRDALPVARRVIEMRAKPFAGLKQPLKALRILPALLNMRPRIRRYTDTKNIPVLAASCKLEQLPHLRSWPEDGGGFITLPQVYSEHPDNSAQANMGMYRIQLNGNEYEPDEAGLHYQLHRGIGAHHAAAIARSRQLPVHIYVGGAPALTLASIMPLPEGISELVFAGLLAGQRTDLARCPGFALPVISEADFLLQAETAPGVKPEGPFGDHIGYYSLKHPFPVLKIKKVWHRIDAIWPFTTVGRPPQEDTIFGDIIHDLTGPMVSQVFPGIEQVHAVDAAGVHALLLAIGHERYTPYEAQRRPAELLTLAMHLLGASQTSLAKYVLITAEEDAPGLNCRNVGDFLAHILERTDFARDLHFITGYTSDTLDYTGGGLHQGSRLVWASAGDPRRSLGAELSELPQLPSGFGRPRIAQRGILVLQGAPHTLPVGQPDKAINEYLCTCLAQWPLRENFPLIVVADDAEFCAANLSNFLWVTFTRSDPAMDIYGLDAQEHSRHWQCRAPLIIDARRKSFHAPALEEDPAIVRKVEGMAAKNGPLAGLF